MSVPEVQSVCVCARVCMCARTRVHPIAQICQTLATLWTTAHQVPLSMEFSRQEYWSGLPFFIMGNLPRSPEVL